jgi:hypothetical protein
MHLHHPPRTELLRSTGSGRSAARRAIRCQESRIERDMRSHGGWRTRQAARSACGQCRGRSTQGEAAGQREGGATTATGAALGSRPQTAGPRAFVPLRARHPQLKRDLVGMDRATTTCGAAQSVGCELRTRVTRLATGWILCVGPRSDPDALPGEAGVGAGERRGGDDCRACEGHEHEHRSEHDNPGSKDRQQTP